MAVTFANMPEYDSAMWNQGFIKIDCFFPEYPIYDIQLISNPKLLDPP